LNEKTYQRIYRMPGGIELAVIAAVVLLLFGGKKIPELAKGIGKGIKDFKTAVKEDEVVADAKDSVKEIKPEVKEATKTEVKDSTKQA